MTDATLVLTILSLLGGYFLAIACLHIILHMLAGQKRLSRQNESKLPDITLLIPAHNEEEMLVEILTRPLQLNLPDGRPVQVIVAENGSSDKTFSLLQTFYQLKPDGDIWQSITHPQLRVVRSSASGKARALNQALRYTHTPIVATLDADTIISDKGIMSALNEFAHRPRLLALGGVIRPMNGLHLKNGQLENNGTRSFLTLCQGLEYQRAFSGERMGLSRLKGNVILSGACALFRQEALRQVGGFNEQSLTEDLDVVLALRQHYPDADGESIDMLPTVLAWTQVPQDLSHWRKQRIRWQIGLWQSLWQYRGQILSTRQGITGLFTLPYLLLVEAIAPVINIAAWGLLAIGLCQRWLDWQVVLSVMGLGLVYSGIMLSWAAVLDNRFKGAGSFGSVFAFFYSIPMNMFYRSYHVLVRMEALVKLPMVKGWGEKRRSPILG